MSQQSFPVGLRNGLISGEHRRRMGLAIWTFMWLVDHVTEEHQDAHGEIRGRVLGGSVIEAERIAADMEVHPDTVRDELRRLEIAGYISRQRCRHGARIEVRNSKKWQRSAFSLPDASSPSNSQQARVGDSETRRLGESEIRTFGETSESPSVRMSDRPIASIDIAEGEDITKNTLPADEEEHAPEAQRIWQAAVAAVEPQTTPGAVEILRRCRGHGVDQNFVFVDWTALAEEERERARRHQLMLGRAAGREIRFGMAPMTNEARAGPERGESHADAAAGP